MNSIRRRRGLIALIARELGLNWQAVSEWERVPLKHVFHVARIAKVKPEKLRPDFFADDPLRA